MQEGWGEQGFRQVLLLAKGAMDEKTQKHRSLKTVSLTSSNTLFLPLLIPSLRAFIHDSFSSKVGA